MKICNLSSRIPISIKQHTSKSLKSFKMSNIPLEPATEDDAESLENK